MHPGAQARGLPKTRLEVAKEAATDRSIWMFNQDSIGRKRAPLGALARVAAFFAAPASLAAAADNLHWRCWYDQQVHITCPRRRSPRHRRGRRRSPLPANIPGIVKLLRKDPGAFRNRIVHVPLHTQPYDMEFYRHPGPRHGLRLPQRLHGQLHVPAAAGEEVIALLNKHVPYLERAMPTTPGHGEID